MLNVSKHEIDVEGLNEAEKLVFEVELKSTFKEFYTFKI